MSYVKLSNGEVDQFPYSIGQLKRDNTNVSFPKNIPEETLNSFDVYSVTVASQPSYTERTQKVIPNTTVSLVDGVWTQGWSVVDKTSEEVQAFDDMFEEMNRNKRNSLLAQTDFYALSDVTMSAEMTTYRQALRDITSHANWPHLEDADWPTKPS